jgi:hypothetical protein
MFGQEWSVISCLKYQAVAKVAYSDTPAYNYECKKFYCIGLWPNNCRYFNSRGVTGGQARTPLPSRRPRACAIKTFYRRNLQMFLALPTNIRLGWKRLS